jgi:hypothetical protein
VKPDSKQQQIEQKASPLPAFWLAEYRLKEGRWNLNSEFKFVVWSLK